MVGLLLALVACGGDGAGSVGPPTPQPGPLNIRLTTPNADDGAILFELAGGPIDSIVRTQFRVASSAPGTTPRRAIVSGNLVGGTIAQLWVPDVNSVGRYSASIRDVAARGTYALRDLQGYRIEVARP
jgi:hypothetical protein